MLPCSLTTSMRGRQKRSFCPVPLDAPVGRGGLNLNAERKLARELAVKMADDRAHRIASMAAEELLRCEGAPTSPDQFSIPRCQADDHMRECIAHLCWHGEAASHETEDGYIVVQLGDFTIGGGD